MVSFHSSLSSQRHQVFQAVPHQRPRTWWPLSHRAPACGNSAALSSPSAMRTGKWGSQESLWPQLETIYLFVVTCCFHNYKKCSYFSFLFLLLFTSSIFVPYGTSSGSKSHFERDLERFLWELQLWMTRAEGPAIFTSAVLRVDWRKGDAIRSIR